LNEEPPFQKAGHKTLRRIKKTKRFPCLKTKNFNFGIFDFEIGAFGMKLAYFFSTGDSPPPAGC
jgi:hypothetical protein